MATLPVSIFVVGMACSTLPAGALARRYGRQAAFLCGNLCGVLAGLMAAAGIVLQSFALFCGAMIFGGAYQAVVLTFRFAAAECVPAAQKPQALSLVMAGGVVAAILGTQLANATMNLWPPHVYAVTYLCAAAVAVLSAAVLVGVRFSHAAVESHAGGRPLAVVLRQPRLMVAMICGVVSYAVMNFLMTSAPLAMDLCGIPRTATTTGIQWHVMAMYAPSFFTGRLIARFGAPWIMLTGFALLAGAALVGASGNELAHFWISLILLGVGWNFGFLGASAEVLECHRPAERTAVQSCNDFVVFGAMAVASFASGGIVTSLGWPVVCWLALPFAVMAAAGTLWLRASGAARAGA
jgi:MFS family permease